MQRSSPEYVPCYLIFDIANDIYQFCRFTGFIKIDNFVNVGDYLLCLRMQTRNPEFHLWEHLPEGRSDNISFSDIRFSFLEKTKKVKHLGETIIFHYNLFPF